MCELFVSYINLLVANNLAMKRLSVWLLLVAVLMCLFCDGFEARKMGDTGKVFMLQNEGRALVQSVPSPGVGH